MGGGAYAEQEHQLTSVRKKLATSWSQTLADTLDPHRHPGAVLLASWRAVHRKMSGVVWKSGAVNNVMLVRSKASPLFYDGCFACTRGVRWFEPRLMLPLRY